MPIWETQGSHRFYCEADLLFLELHGVFALADTQHMYATLVSIEKEYGYALLGFDARDVAGMAADARRYIGERTRVPTVQSATAIAGANFTIRTVVKLLQNAARLFGNPRTRTHFCATPTEATEWLGGQRPLLRTANAGRRSS